MGCHDIEGVGELGWGGFGEGGVGHVVEDGDAAFDQFEVEFGEEAVEAAVLFFEELVAELVFVGGPFLQGFAGDVELGCGLLEVAVELVEEVERLDFVVEWVAAFHGWVLSNPSPPGPLSHKGRGGALKAGLGFGMGIIFGSSQL